MNSFTNHLQISKPKQKLTARPTVSYWEPSTVAWALAVAYQCWVEGNGQLPGGCPCCKGTLLGHGGVQWVFLCRVSFQSLSHLLPEVVCFQPLSAWDSPLGNFGLFLLCLWYLQRLRPVNPQGIGGGTAHLFLLTSDSVQIAQPLCGVNGSSSTHMLQLPAVLASWEAGTNAGIYWELEEMLKACLRHSIGNFQWSHILLHLFFDCMLSFLFFS